MGYHEKVMEVMKRSVVKIGRFFLNLLKTVGRFVFVWIIHIVMWWIAVYWFLGYTELFIILCLVSPIYIIWGPGTRYRIQSWS